MEIIQYDDTLHRYTCKGVRYLSATQVVDHVKPKFDTKPQAVAYADKAGFTPEHWEKVWDEIKDVSLVRGNDIHDRQEFITKHRSIDVIHGKPLLVQNPDLFPETLPYIQYPDGIYAERAIWDHFYRIAGRPDKFAIETIGKKRYVHIDDYKTNKRIRMVSFQRMDGTREMLKAPLDHLMNCEIITYGLQLNLYMHMFRSHGFSTGKMRIIHFPHIPDMAPPGAQPPAPVSYNIPSMQRDVIKLLKHLKRNRTL